MSKVPAIPPAGALFLLFGPIIVGVSAMFDKILDALTTFILGPKRLDHEPMYSCTVAGIVLSTFLSVAMPRSLHSAISNLTVPTQASLVLSLFMGGVVCLYGIAMGTMFDVWRIANRVVRRYLNMPQLLPIDARRYYRVGVCGAPTLVLGLGFYCANIFVNSANVVDLTGACLIGFTTLGMLIQWLRFLMEIRRIGKTLSVLVDQEIVRQEIAEDIHQLRRRVYVRIRVAGASSPWSSGESRPTQ